LNKNIAIIDYKMSNLFSVKAACKKVGMSSIITSDREEILNADIAILPGVGAFGNAMENIKALELEKTIFSFIDSGKLFVGICLGLQLLFDKSEEFGYNQKGLGIIKGNVKKFEFTNTGEQRIPVPQIGWNKIMKNKQKWIDTPLGKNNDKDYMYFIHSFYVKPKNKKIVLSTSKYGNTEYCSSIKENNIFACQFHPEKSGETGLKIYNNIKKWKI
jgi:imidazole glycerol-phosphate synthase subunit HisH